jgi:copper transport protein
VRRAAAFVVCVIALVGLSASPASAHASLLSSDPADGAALDTAPSEVTLTFSERVSAKVGGLRVFANGGARVDRGAVRVTGSVVAIDLKPNLGEGSYVVTYRVISADGHPVRGGLVFGVGRTADAGLLGSFFSRGDDAPFEIAGAILRMLVYGGALLAAGGAMFLAFVDDGDRERGTLRRLIVIASGVSAAAALAAIPVLAALATGQGVGAVLQDGVLRAVLGEGVGWAIVVLLAGLGLVAIGRNRIATVTGAVLAAESFAITGHTRVTDPAWMATVADIAHTFATAFWFGGTVCLSIVVARRRVGAAPAVARFAQLAAFALGAVVATGSALSWAEVRTTSAVTSTTYGLLLTSKVLVIVAVVGLAAANRWSLIPAIDSGEPDRAQRAMHRLGTFVRLETVGLALAVVATAVLVNVTPARVSAGVGELFSGTVQLGPAGSVDVIVDPAQAGPNAIHLYFFDPAGRPADLASEVTLRLSLPAAGIGPIVRTPVRAGPAHLQLDGSELSVAGRWTIEIGARLSEFDKVTGSVEVQVRG